MFWPLKTIFERVVRDGRLTVRDAGGRVWHFGNGSGQAAGIALTTRTLEVRLALQPELAAAEGYMNGELLIEDGDLYGFIDLIARNLSRHPLPVWARAPSRMRSALRVLPEGPTRSRQHISYHYDLDTEFYALFLDRDLQYSCAYFRDTSSLDDAQLAKKQHLAAKLNLKPGARVLDIGCGWGGLALFLAGHCSADVTGITLSAPQREIATKRARDEGLSDHASFKLEDYRTIAGTFSRIVSVGMFEHVGPKNYATYFARISDLLEPGGVALVHTIGRSDQPSPTNPFIAKWIFPGGYLPALSEVSGAIEKSGLIISDVEVLREHYALTLREWRRRFTARRNEAVALRGERHCRMWEFYLAACEAAFRHQDLVVFQVQLIKRNDALPNTRDYMSRAEDELRAPQSSAAAARAREHALKPVGAQ